MNLKLLPRRVTLSLAPYVALLLFTLSAAMSMSMLHALAMSMSCSLSGTRGCPECMLLKLGDVQRRGGIQYVLQYIHAPVSVCQV